MCRWHDSKPPAFMPLPPDMQHFQETGQYTSETGGEEDRRHWMANVIHRKVFPGVGRGTVRKQGDPIGPISFPFPRRIVHEVTPWFLQRATELPPQEGAPAAAVWDMPDPPTGPPSSFKNGTVYQTTFGPNTGLPDIPDRAHDTYLMVRGGDLRYTTVQQVRPGPPVDLSDPKMAELMETTLQLKDASTYTNEHGTNVKVEQPEPKDNSFNTFNVVRGGDQRFTSVCGQSEGAS
jgi:hypothetical protein